MKKAQPKELSDENRRLTLAILGFSRMLLENCTNRNLYASYEVWQNMARSNFSYKAQYMLLTFLPLVSISN